MPGPWINPYLSAGCRFVFYLGPTIWQPLAVITCSSVKCQAVRLLSEPQKFGHFFLHQSLIVTIIVIIIMIIVIITIYIYID